MWRIGVTPTTQTLKCLEGIECPSDPRPLKKRSPPKDDEVSLDWSGNEDDVNVFMEESAVAGPSGTSHRYVRKQKANDLTDVIAVTRKYHSNTKYLVPNQYSFVCCPLRVNEDQSEATWMLDSGASCHFTNNMNDFVEFEENVGPERVMRTTNSSTSIAGKGTVIFTVNGERVMLSRRWYILHYHRSTLLLPLRGEVVADGGGVEGRSEVMYWHRGAYIIYYRDITCHSYTV